MRPAHADHVSRRPLPGPGPHGGPPQAARRAPLWPLVRVRVRAWARARVRVWGRVRVRVRVRIRVRVRARVRVRDTCRLGLRRCFGLCNLRTQLVDRELHLSSIQLPLRAEALVGVWVRVRVRARVSSHSAPRPNAWHNAGAVWRG
eukprot:scaffold93344_cov57-Phaeocystis_antarctica.AAC.2